MSRRSPAPGRTPPAVVVGLDCITGLQTARILSRRGVPVTGVASDAVHPCCRTRSCRELLASDLEGPELLRTLEAFGARSPLRPVLVPCTDESVLAISRAREELTRHFDVVLAGRETVETLVDKASFHALLGELGLPTPTSRVLRSPADAEGAAEALRFPCVLKPSVKTRGWKEHAPSKVLLASDGGALLDLYERYGGLAETFVAQEWVEGEDAELYSCNCYYDRQSRPVVTFVARKLRQWPPRMGTSTLGEECRNDEVLEATLTLFGAVSFRGLGYVEMKRDPVSGRHLLLEANVGRPTGRSAIAEAGGVELVYSMYCDAAGLAAPEATEQLYGRAKWIYGRQDLRSAYYYWRRGELSAAGWIRSLRGRPKARAVFSWRDPLPFLADLAGGTRKYLAFRAARRRAAVGSAA